MSEKWVVSQEVYDEIKDLKFGTPNFYLFSEALYDIEKQFQDEYPKLNEFLFGRKEISVLNKNQFLFARAWAGEIEVEVEKPKQYWLFQIEKSTGRKCYVVKYPSDLIDYNFDKRFATRFTAEEYPHYKNDFMMVEEVIK